MCCLMQKPGFLKTRRYEETLTGINEYLYVFPGSDDSNKMGKEEINYILLHHMFSGYIKQA